MSIRCYFFGHADSKYFESKKENGKIRVRTCSRCTRTFSKTCIDNSGAIQSIEVYQGLLTNPAWSPQDT